MLNKSDKEPLIKAASIASLFVSSTLIIIKYYGWAETDSISLLGSLADSLMDFLASIFVFIAISFSLLPADEKYRFGYGKSEGVGSAVFLVNLSVRPYKDSFILLNGQLINQILLFGSL